MKPSLIELMRNIEKNIKKVGMVGKQLKHY